MNSRERAMISEMNIDLTTVGDSPDRNEIRYPHSYSFVLPEELQGERVLSRWKAKAGKRKEWRQYQLHQSTSHLNGPGRNQRKKAMAEKMDINLYSSEGRALESAPSAFDLDIGESGKSFVLHNVKRKLDDSEHDLLPAYESYIGAILGEQFQLGAMIREDGLDRRTYEIQPLMNPQWKLEATAFSLTGLPEKLLALRKRQLRQLKKRSLCQIDQAGLKFVIHEPRNMSASQVDIHPCTGGVVSESHFPRMNSHNGPITLAVTGESWAAMTRALAQNAQPCSQTAEPKEVALSQSSGGAEDRYCANKPHVSDDNIHIGKRPRRKRRSGKAKITLMEPPMDPPSEAQAESLDSHISDHLKNS
ncbi:hypothetical protein PG984_016106 [Apiospora sp. TS-2023a]